MEAAEIVDVKNASKKINLNVSFNGAALTTVGTPVEVVGEDGATTEIRSPLVITPVAPGGGYAEGNYRGFVKVMFDAP